MEAQRQSAPTSPPGLHPRRRPAHESVSLRRSAKPVSSSLKREYTGANEDASPDSRDSSSPRLISKESSGETSNADRWFDKANKNPNVNRRGFNDDDPPYRPDNSTPSANARHNHMHPIPPVLQSSGSSSDEYRGVIDDLTIQLKKLQRKLKKYESNHDDRLDSDKRVEVKTYGLPVEKKRELEMMLSKFTASLNDSPVSAPKPSSSTALASSSALASSGSGLASNAMATNSSASANPTAPKLKPSESTSTTIFADSGYGSLTQTAQKQTKSPETARRPSQVAAFAQSRDRQIQSYLQDIPAGLLPRAPVAMTVKSKQKLVVKRLEQIIDGRGAAPGVHHQSIQQQEVSQAAASADRLHMESLGQRQAREGDREAPIMPEESEDAGEQGKRSDGAQIVSKQDHVLERDFAAPDPSNPEPEQRPTRPMDLDPDRALLASENVKYLEHLGFHLHDASLLTENSDNEGWVYLNLMIGLAQLHTLNVTTDFVREAVSKYSKHFELSMDGRKIRWNEPNRRMKSSTDGSHSLTNSDMPGSNVGQLKRSFAAMAGIGQDGRPNPHEYVPLFRAKDSDISDDGSESVAEAETLHQSGDASGDMTSGFASGSGLTAANKARRGDAPMIFYQQARFYTDLSADPKMPLLSLARHSTSGTNKQPLGVKPAPLSKQESHQPRSRPLFDSPLPETEEVNDTDDIMDVDFPTTSPRRVAFADEREDSIAFQASGIGGVYPSDHFSIAVQRQHALHSPKTAAKTWSLPNRLISNSASKDNARPARREDKILGSKRISLPPSELPPPSYGFALGEDDEDDETIHDSASDISGPVPSTADLPRLVASSAYTSHPSKRRRITRQHSSPSSASTQVRSASHEAHAGGKSSSRRATYSSAFSSSSSDSSSTSSTAEHNEQQDDEERGAPSDAIDFLAYARKVNPEAIRRKEREYDAELAERLAEEIPAGSSAATAGGGSGWGSPVGAGAAGDGAGDGEEADSDAEAEVGSVSS